MRELRLNTEWKSNQSWRKHSTKDSYNSTQTLKTNRKWPVHVILRCLLRHQLNGDVLFTKRELPFSPPHSTHFEKNWLESTFHCTVYNRNPKFTNFLKILKYLKDIHIIVQRKKAYICYHYCTSLTLYTIKKHALRTNIADWTTLCE